MLLSVLSLAPLFLGAPLAPASIQEKKLPPSQEPGLVLASEFAGLDALLVDEKDEGLAQALGYVADRLVELPAEFGEFGLSPGMVSLALRTFAGPFRVVVAGPGGQGLADYRLDAAFSKAGADEATAIADEVRSFLGMLGFGFGEPNEEGLAAATDGSPVWMGAVGADLVFRAGADEALAGPSFEAELPEGTRFALGMAEDYGAHLDLLLALDDSEGAADAQELFQSFGLDQIRYTAALGTNEEAFVARYRFEGAGEVLRRTGLLPEKPLSSTLVRLVPKDAMWAAVFSVNLLEPLDTFLEFLRREDRTTLGKYDETVAALGFDPREGFLAALSGRFAVYGSETTGGGMLSTVLIAELKDAAKMRATWESIEASVEKLGREKADGYVAFGTTRDGSVRVHSLHFPGLPVPSELTYTIADRYLIVGLSPQAVLAARGQVAGADTSLFDAEGFHGQLAGASINSACGLLWFDTPHMVTSGYETLGLLTAALSNAVRSREDPWRGGGLLLPTLAELRHGALPVVETAHLVDGDLIVTVRADRSMLVNAAGFLGSLYRTPMGLLGVLEGALLAAPQQVRDRILSSF